MASQWTGVEYLIYRSGRTRHFMLQFIAEIIIY